MCSEKAYTEAMAVQLIGCFVTEASKSTTGNATFRCEIFTSGLGFGGQGIIQGGYGWI